MTVVLLVLVGLLAGVVSALCGVGGGVIVVPALLWLKGFDIKLAVGTSLAMIIPTALVGVWRKWPTGQVDLKVAAIVAGGAIVGAVVGSWLTDVLPDVWVKRTFAVVLAAVSVKLFLEG